MNKIFVVTALSIILSISSFAQNVEYGAVVGATKGLFFNTIESFDDDEFKLTSGITPVFGIYGQKKYSTLFNVGIEVQLCKHELAFSHQVEDDFISYRFNFTESTSQVKVSIVNQSDIFSFKNHHIISSWIGFGGSLNTFTVASWEDHISIKEDDSLYYAYSTTDNVGTELFIPEALIGLSYKYDKPFLFFKNVSIRGTYHYPFKKLIEKPTKYSFSYNRDNGPENRYEASWAGRLTYFDLVLRLAVF